jgi:micrococcal nuclease
MRRSLLLFALLLAACAQRDLRTVVRVIDGDTIMLNGEERVRLIGIDTPETVHPGRPVECYGREASAYLKKALQGRRVRLEFDQQHKDRYGRTLAYLYRSDGTFVNAEMIRQGYAHAYTRYPFRHLEQFRKLERDARQAGRGLWGPACSAP